MTYKWDQEQIEHYERNAIEYSQLYNSTYEETFHFNYIFNNFIKFLSLDRGSRIIEMGCGTGRYTIPLLKKGFNLYGIDFSKESLKILRNDSQKNDLNGSLKGLIVATGNEIPIRKDSFDAAICVHVLHHVPYIKKVIIEMTKVVRKGGVVACLEPNPFCPYWYISIPINGLKKWNIEKGLVRCTDSNFRSIFKSAGLTNIKIENRGFIPPKLMDAPSLQNFCISIDKYMHSTKLPFVKRLSAIHFVKGTK